MGLQFKINTITSDGAALIQRAKDNSDLVLIYQAVSIPDILGRNDAANFSASRFVTSEITQYLPASNNIDAVSKSVAGDDVSFVSVQAKLANTASAPCKSIVLLACLYSEREAPSPVAFAVLSDDNSAIIADGVSVSIPLNLPTKYIKLFGADSTQAQIDDIVSDLAVVTGDITDIQDDISDLQTFNIDDETGIPETGIHYTLKREEWEDVEIPRESVVLSCELIDGALVFTTGNGDVFSISGENVTIEKSTLYPITEIEVLFGVLYKGSTQEWESKDLYPGYNYGCFGILSADDKAIIEEFGLLTDEYRMAASYGIVLYNAGYTLELIGVYSDMGETPIEISDGDFALSHTTESNLDFFTITNTQGYNHPIKSFKVKFTKNEPVPPTPTPTTKKAYVNSWKGNGSFSFDDGSINNVYDEDGNALKYDGTKTYTVTGGYLADDTSVSYTSIELTDQQNTMMGLAWTGLTGHTLCYVEYTEE